MYDNNVEVKDIILPSRGWNDNKLRNIVLPFECKAICKVPICEVGRPDTRYWKYEKKGFYSVRTGYWTTVDNQHSEREEMGKNGSGSSTDKLWSKI